MKKKYFCLIAFATMIAFPSYAQNDVNDDQSDQSLAQNVTQMDTASWDDQLINVIDRICDKTFNGVEVTSDLVKEFLRSPLGTMTVAIVFWKVVGTEIVNFCLVGAWFLFVVFISWYMLRGVFGRTRTIKKGERKGEYVHMEGWLKKYGENACIFVALVYCIVLAFGTLAVSCLF